MTTTMMNCWKHGQYLNVNGCPDCNQPRIDAIRAAIGHLRSRPPSPALRAEHAKLDRAYRSALDVTHRSITGGTDRQVAAVESTWEALVDWVENRGLNYSELDPRGTTDPSEDDDLAGQ